MKVYLAGKVGHTDWRHSIVENLRNWDSYIGNRDAYDEAAHAKVPTWPIWAKVIFGTHDYVGPYFVSCDHGCFHGNNLHGAIGGGCSDSLDPVSMRMQVSSRCQDAIRHTDVLFAWIEKPDCYGTLMEIGYAHALGKSIYIAGPCYFDDLWLTYTLAKHVTFISTDELRQDFDETRYMKAFMKWCLDGKPDHRSYIDSWEWQTIANSLKARVGFRCQVCNRSKNETILDAHHRTYDRLGWERMDDITILCRTCHELYETNRRERQVMRKIIELPSVSGPRREKRRAKKR